MNTNNYSCDHIGILSNNAERLIKFYKTNLGFRLISAENLSSNIVKKLFKVNTTCCFYRLKFEDLLLEIFQPHKKIKKLYSNKCNGIHHFGLRVQNRELFIKHLRGKKVKIITIKRNERKIYFIKDPDGNIIEIREAR
ncbi:MAG: VOC family protein [candidate division WOR-3 bacterium]